MPTIPVLSHYNYSELDIFLKKHKATTGGYFTHTSISGYKNSYYIGTEELDEFYKYYHDHVWIKNLSCHLTEGIRDCDITPVKIDLDFRKYIKTDKDIPDRIYELDDIIKICQKYMEAIEQWLVSPDPVERYCFIMEKPNAVYDINKLGEIKINDNGERRVKDGVHIMFPYICTKTFLQLEFRNLVYKNVGDILDKYNYDESYAEIFDKAVIDRNNWQMYGSNKGKDFGTYKVTKILEIYKDSFKEIDLKEYDNAKLLRLLSVRNKTEESMIQYEKKSILEKNEETHIELEKKKKKYSSKGKTTKKNKISKEDMYLITGQGTPGTNDYKPGYMDCLSISRAQNYNSWMEVGWALHNIDNVTGIHAKNNSTNLCYLLQKWIQWSKQEGTGYENEPIDTYVEIWEKMRSDGVGFGSLKLWAKEDNLATYNKIVNNDLYSYLLKASGKQGGSSYDVARVMYQMYKDTYICVSIKDSLWFYYDNNLHKWIEDDKGIRLKTKISTEVWEKFQEVAKSLMEKASPGDENDIRVDQMRATQQKLKTTNFKSHVMSECMEIFYDHSREFYNKLDSNLNLIGFNNGVYDLELDEFRKGRPEDYITMSTKIDFISYDPYTTEMKNINKFIDEILTIKPVKEYVIKLMSTFLSGSTRSEKFHVWSGSGGNGKSKLIELLEKSLGDYAGKINVSNLTQKRGSAGQANPELARTKGKRFVNMQEPDEQCRLNVGLMKELTGGDKIITRALFKDPIEFKPQFTLVLTCNEKPEMPPDDEGTWRRVVLVEYKSKFRHEPQGTWKDINNNSIDNNTHKLNIENKIYTDYWCPSSIDNPQFPIDETLNEKFDSWAEPFMSYLIQIYKENKHVDLIEPDEVKEYTKKYRESNQHFKDFFNDKVIFDNSTNNIIKLENIFQEYKVWYKDNNGTSQNQKKQKDMKAFMEKEYGDYWEEGVPYRHRGYKGYIVLSSSHNKDDLSEDFLEESDTEDFNKCKKQNINNNYIENVINKKDDLDL